MNTVTRITPMSETELTGAAALVALARDIMAGQAREGAPTINVGSAGIVSLTYPDGGRIKYVTDLDTATVPVVRA